MAIYIPGMQLLTMHIHNPYSRSPDHYHQHDYLDFILLHIAIALAMCSKGIPSTIQGTDTNSHAGLAHIANYGQSTEPRSLEELRNPSSQSLQLVKVLQ